MKQCKSCRMEINCEAETCPYCRAYQNYLKISFRNPLASILIFLSVYGVFYYYTNSITQSSLKRLSEHNFKEHNISILNHRLIKSEKSTRVMGELVNNANESWGAISLVAVFYNMDKESLVIGSGYIHRDLEPGEKAAFQIDVGCSDENDLELIKGYSHYEIEIESASIKVVTPEEMRGN